MNRTVLAVGLLVTLPLIGLLVANLGRDPQAIESPLIGRSAPPFAMTPVGGGEPISLEALRGQPVVINFWATWCVPCYAEHPVLNRAAQTLGSRVHFVGVVYQDEPEAVRKFLEREGASYPSLVDDTGGTAIAYGVYGVPETFFISPGGVIAAKHVGPLTPELIAGYLQQALAADGRAS